MLNAFSETRYEHDASRYNISPSWYLFTLQQAYLAVTRWVCDSDGSGGSTSETPLNVAAYKVVCGYGCLNCI